MQKLLTTVLALLALAMGLSHAGAMAAGAMAAPAMVSPMADSASADMPCHGAAADAPDVVQAATGHAEAVQPESGQSAPDCCPDGCKGGCAMLAALSGEAVGALPDALHGQTPLPIEARAPADRPLGLKRPPRATA